MKITTNAVLILLAAGFIFTSCAKRESINVDTLREKSLAEWIKKHKPEATQLGEYPIYYEVIQEAEQGAENISLDTWLVHNYQVRDLQGNVVYNREEEMAKRQGEFTPYAYYKPDFQFYGEDISQVTTMKGMNLGLMDMKVGEIRKFYIAPSYAYGSEALQNINGYGGQYQLSANSIAIIDNLQVTEIVENPEEREMAMVENLVTQPAPIGLGLSLADSVKEYLYLQILKRDPEADTIADGETAKIYFRGNFFDGFMFDTNIDSVWRNKYGEVRYFEEDSQVDNTESISVKRETSIPTSVPALGFHFLLPELHYGDSCRVVMISRYAYHSTGRAGYKAVYGSSVVDDMNYYYDPYMYGYGNYGSGYGSGYGGYYDSYYYMMNYYNSYANSNYEYFPITEVKPYTPLEYTFVVMPKEEDDDDGDDDETTE